MPQADLDALFSAPLKEFIEERRRTAKALKAAGQGERAKQIEKIPKPTVSAWAVNQLARRKAPLFTELGTVAASLREAQLEGRVKPNGLSYPELLARHRDILKTLRAEAETLLTDAGHAPSPQVVERVIRNIRDGVASETTRRLIEAGQLSADLEAQDFADLLGQATFTGDRAAVASRPRQAGGPATGADRQTAASRAEERKRLQQELRSRAEAHAAAKRQVQSLRTALSAARHTEEREHRVVAARREQLIEAERRVEAAQAEAERLSAALRSAEEAMRKPPAA